MDAVKHCAWLLVPLLASCGGSDTNVLEPPTGDVFNLDGPVVNACASNYYTELVGDYDGQIVFRDSELRYTLADDTLFTCTWEVDLQVSSAYTSDPDTRTICDLTFSMTSNVTGTTGGVGPELCSDVGIGGDLIDTLGVSRELWTNPPYPIDAFAQVPTAIPGDMVFPIGVAGQAVSQFTLTFDGMGNITLPDSITAEPDYSGVLVKQ